MTSTIVNGGYKIRPHLVDRIQKSDGSIEYTPLKKEKIEWVKDEYLDLVKKGMRGVVLEGSGRWYANNDYVAIAGKTGTAENPHGFSHGWFTSFSPYEDPKIVVTVFMENGGFASSSAAPVAALMHERYITGETNNTRIYNHVLNWVPKEDNSSGN